MARIALGPRLVNSGVIWGISQRWMRTEFRMGAVRQKKCLLVLCVLVSSRLVSSLLVLVRWAPVSPAEVSKHCIVRPSSACRPPCHPCSDSGP